MLSRPLESGFVFGTGTYAYWNGATVDQFWYESFILWFESFTKQFLKRTSAENDGNAVVSRRETSRVHLRIRRAKIKCSKRFKLQDRWFVTVCCHIVFGPLSRRLPRVDTKLDEFHVWNSKIPHAIFCWMLFCSLKYIIGNNKKRAL